ncbi:hypothetical protein EUX98_g8371, partial [Antrodiella citrinella]
EQYDLWDRMLLSNSSGQVTDWSGIAQDVLVGSAEKLVQKETSGIRALFANTLAIPIFVSIVSLLVLLLHCAWSLFTRQKAAAVIPLCVPRAYIPLDPKHPSEALHPEQTASILSRLVYTYLDSLILQANRVEHLPLDQLPPNPDYDEAKNLIVQNLANCVNVRSTATITQLVFDHALRIRVKAETSRESTSNDATANVTPDNASAVVPTGDEGGEEDPNKAKAQEPSISEASTSTKVAEQPKPKSDNFVGKLNNLVTNDLSNINNGSDFVTLVIFVPFQLVLSVVFLYAILGWSAFVGVGATVLCFPIPGMLSKLLASAQAQKMKMTDARVQSVTETMSIIRMVKLFGWEPKMTDRIAKIRDEELTWIFKTKALQTFTGISGFAIPFVTTIATYGAYSILMKKTLTVFSSMVVFDMFRGLLWETTGKAPLTITAKVSLDRLNAFLYETELLDEYSPTFSSSYNNPDVEPRTIGFKDAEFTWDSSEDSGAVTPGSSRRSFTLHIDDELFFKRGHINLIVGPTGSGKTSMLMALLGEMHYIPATPGSYFNLPRDGGIAYASQESWVQNETIRDNILFGTEYEEERYNKVLEQCGLKRDLELFEAGDMTEVGEKGLTLSGGQKARVTLARAVYSYAEIVLLDDVLAALDVHTAKGVVDQCFKGDVLRGRTVILVVSFYPSDTISTILTYYIQTHNIALTAPIAEFVVSMGKNGRVSNQGSLKKILAKDTKLSAELQTEEEQLAKVDNEIDDQALTGTATKKPADGKLVVAEEIAIGHVGWSAAKLFFSTLGGKRWFWWWGALVMNMTCTPFSETFLTWYLGYWARQYEERPASEVSAPYYLIVYTIMIIASVSLNTTGYIIYLYGQIRSCRAIHNKLVTSILSSTMRWLDVTPTSRVISRCTQDISAVDGAIPALFQRFIEITMFMIARFIAVTLVAPAALIPGFMVTVAGVACAQLYLRAQLAIKREMSNAQAPILSHFGAAMTGLISIRAYGAQKAVKLESFKRIDHLTRATPHIVSRWMAVRIEAIGSLFAAGIAAYLVYGTGVSASNTGFALNMAVGFCELIRWWIYGANRIEVQANSLERIQQFLEIEHEPTPTPEGVPPAYWPASGKLTVEKLSARYSEDGPKVLHDVSFTINSGERVGIVGRTGSGKSSLTLALLRCILTDGSVLFDDLPTGNVNLDVLRSNITIIPQVPELLSGTLRQNLDPFGEYDDAVLNDSLRAAGLFSLQHHEDEARLTLDSSIASGGGNLSVGQRQILALARAMVRRSKLLILDEATSAIDNETDNVIQASLRNELDKGVTLLTIAHRLQTIMDANKIKTQMVLDAGRIVEFGEPRELLKNEQGIFRALVDESGDKENLHRMVAGAN